MSKSISPTGSLSVDAPSSADLSYNLRELGLAIVASHIEACKLRDVAISACHAALLRAVSCGELLLQAQQRCEDHSRGKFFEVWLLSQIESFEDFPSRPSCYRYMRAVRFRHSLGDECPDFSSVKELYIAAGILPPPTPAEHSSASKSPAIFRLSFELCTPDPSEWEAIDRREFLTKAQPIVDLYQRCKAAESE